MRSSPHRQVASVSSRKPLSRSLELETLESRVLLTVDLVSVSPGAPPDPLFAGTNATIGDVPASTNPGISGSGRYVAFQSKADNLIVPDENAAEDVFVRDLETGVTTLISVNAAGTNSGVGKTFGGASVQPTISEDGRFVTFVSFAQDLVTGIEVERLPNVYVRDRDPDMDGIYDEPGEATTRLLSIAEDGTAAGFSGSGPFGTNPDARPIISADGSYVTFASSASDLAITQTAPDGSEIVDANLGYDVVRAATDGSGLEFLSLNVDGTATTTFVFGVRSASVSVADGDGTVAYVSSGFDLVETVPVSPLDWSTNIFATSGGPNTLVSINAEGTNGGNGASKNPAISRDGRHVAFISRATDLVDGITDQNGLTTDIFVRDLETMTTILVSRSGVLEDSTANAASPLSFAATGNFWGGPSISDDGRFIAFVSAATDLLASDSPVVDDNIRPDAYVLDRDTDGDGVFDEPGGTEMILVSVNDATSTAGVGGFFGALNPTISANGRFVAFSTDATVVPGVASGMHVYVRDLEEGVTYLVSPGDGGSGGQPGASSGGSSNVTISNFDNRIDRIAYISLAPDLDPNVSDTNSGLDIYAFTPPTDIRATRNFSTGTTTHSQGYRIWFEEAEPFEIGYYRSIDRTFDPETDELLGVSSVTTPEAFAIGTNLFADVEIAGEEATVSFPGTIADDLLEDYFLLSVIDHTNAVPEFDGDPFNEDNASAVRGVYHLPDGPIYVHGSERSDSMSATVDGGAVIFDYGATAFDLPGTFEYELGDETASHVRLHEGDDEYRGSELVDIVFAGPGNDKVSTGPGDDIVFDGPGDDSIDTGSGDDIIVSTPGSDDIFIDGGGDDLLDFSFADNAITIDLDFDELQTVDDDLNTIDLDGIFENIIGSVFDDELTLRPIPGTRTADGGPGFDRLIVDVGGEDFIDDGDSISFPFSAFGTIHYVGFEDIEIISPRLFGDFDADGEVSFEDFLAFSRNFGNTSLDRLEGDFNGDRTVDFTDFLMFSRDFGRRIDDELTPQRAANSSHDPSTAEQHETVEFTEIVAALDQASEILA